MILRPLILRSILGVTFCTYSIQPNFLSLNKNSANHCPFLTSFSHYLFQNLPSPVISQSSLHVMYSPISTLFWLLFLFFLFFLFIFFFFFTALGLCCSHQAFSTAHSFTCPEACGILVPQPGIEVMSPALKGSFLTTEPPGKSLMLAYS